MNPSIIIGNPLEKRASFTRFVLPFAWEPVENNSHTTPAAGQESGYLFEMAAASDWLHNAELGSKDGPEFLDDARRRYLTPETDRLLFKRASWFVLRDKGTGSMANQEKQIWKEFTIDSVFGGPGYNVALRPPAAVLFEWPPDTKHEQEPDPLRIGFLIHEAFFPSETESPGIGDLLRFNEIFRYWREPYDKFMEQCGSEVCAFCLGVRQREQCPGKRESEGCFQHWRSLMRYQFFEGSDCRGQFRQTPPAGGDANPAFPAWLVHPDDRAFTMPFVVLRTPPEGAFDPYQFKSSHDDPDTGGLWVKILNVDRIKKDGIDSLSNSTLFEKEWARIRTYTRWAHSHSLYGFSEHSFAHLGTYGGSPPPLGEPPLGLHFGQMYFDSTLLHLYTRVALFHFSEALHRITSEARDETGKNLEIEEWQKKFGLLRWQYLQFENLYRFPLFSNQQQHLEMFEIQKKFMDVGTLFDEVSKEIATSDEFLENKLADERNRIAGTLNVVAALALTASLALSWMDAHSDRTQGFWWFVVLLIIFLGSLLGVLGWSDRIGKFFQRLSKPETEIKRISKTAKTKKRPSFQAFRWWPFIPLMISGFLLFFVFGPLSDSREKATSSEAWAESRGKLIPFFNTTPQPSCDPSCAQKPPELNSQAAPDVPQPGPPAETDPQPPTEPSPAATPESTEIRSPQQPDPEPSSEP
jgi:hypothetical protein